MRFDLLLRQRFSELRMKLAIRGDRLDVSEAGSEILLGVLRTAGQLPRWEYSGGCNYVWLTVPLYNTPL